MLWYLNDNYEACSGNKIAYRRKCDKIFVKADLDFGYINDI